MGKEANKVLAKIKKQQEDEKDVKLGLYLEKHALMGYHGYYNYVIIGARGRGKSVISVDIPIALKRKYGYENVKVYYFRISDLSVKAMLSNKASKAIDPILIHRYDLDITCKNNIVYDHGKELIEFYPLVSAGKTGKGVNLYDATFLNNRPIDPKTGKPIKRFIVTIWDEFLLADGIEKKTVGDPVAQYKIFMESIMRDQERLDYDAVKMLYLANTVSECANVTGQLFNFIPKPGDFGIKKLTRKHTLFWNVPNSEAYLEKRKRSIMADIMDYDNDPNYTNIVQRDLDTIMEPHRRLRRVTRLIKFGKLPIDGWFCEYDGKYIRRWKGETVAKDLVLPMIRYLDEVFSPEMVKEVIQKYDARALMYADIMSQAMFSAKLKIIKSK